jgi:recombination protein RecT
MPTSSLTDRRAAVEERRGTRGRSVRDLVREQLPEYVAALPRGTIDPQRFVRVALTVLRDRPELESANRLSLMGGLMHAAQMGLEIGGGLAEFYLTGPFKMRSGDLEVVSIIGYRGLITLALRDERVLAIKAEVVREGDDFDFAYGDDERLSHRPRLTNYDAPIVAAWAMARLLTSSGQEVKVYKVIGRQEIDAARGRARASESGPWVTDFAAMARKTVIRRFLTGGEVPMRLEMRDALSMDERPVHFDVDSGEVVAVDDDVIDVEPGEAAPVDAEVEPVPEDVPPPDEPEPEAS